MSPVVKWRPRLPGGASLWPLWALLILAFLILAGRGCAPRPTDPADAAAGAARATVTTTVLAPPPGVGGASGATPYAGGTAATLTRGPAGTAVTPTTRSIARCDIDRLPSQARRTVQLVQAGGPFPYPRNDGVLFRNSEGLLPPKKEGYYREYTVATPGADTRATRRIVTGGDPATNPPEWYYTNDHYQSFCRITGRL